MGVETIYKVPLSLLCGAFLLVIPYHTEVQYLIIGVCWAVSQGAHPHKTSPAVYPALDAGVEMPLLDSPPVMNGAPITHRPIQRHSG